MKQLTKIRRKIYNTNNLQRFSKQILQDIQQNPGIIYPSDKTKTYNKWPQPKLYPTPPLYGIQKTTHPYSQSTFCYLCQDTREKLKHSTYNCPHEKCMKCKAKGHTILACLEINTTLPPFTIITKNTPTKGRKQQTSLKSTKRHSYIPTEKDINDFLKTLRDKQIIQTPTKTKGKPPKEKTPTHLTTPKSSPPRNRKNHSQSPKVIEVITLDSPSRKQTHAKNERTSQDTKRTKKIKNYPIPDLPTYKNTSYDKPKHNNRTKPRKSLIPDLPKPNRTHNNTPHSQTYNNPPTHGKPHNRSRQKTSSYNQGHLSDISSDELISSDEF